MTRLRRAMATLSRMNLVTVIPITLLLFAVAPEQNVNRLWRIAVLVAVVSNCNFIPLTVLYHRVWTRLRFRSVLPYVVLILLVLPATAVVCAAAALLILRLVAWFEIPTFWELLQINVPLVVVYGGTYFLLSDYRHRLAGASANLKETQRQHGELVLERDELKLFALQIFLNPHFLFNSLNTIAALIHSHPGQAEEATIRLARVLRRIVATADTSLVPLSTELAIVNDYLHIEQIRLGKRMIVSIDVPDAVLPLEVPAMVVQPLVENAIHHGIRQRPDAGHLRLHAWKDRDRIHIEVSDDGPGVSSHHGTGQARRLLHDRLDALYGRGNYEMNLLRDEARGETIAALCLPVSRS